MLKMTVAELVQKVPSAATVFEVVQINACCKRERTLVEACKAAGIDAEEVVALLEEVPIPPRGQAPSFAESAPLTSITTAIRDEYHRRARKFLVVLTRAVRALCGSHGQTQQELWTLRSSIEELSRDLVPHMHREERYLFPYMNALDGGRMEKDIVVPLFGTVEYPLQFVRHDHSHDLEAIEKMRALTHDLTPGADSCTEVRSFYSMLRDFLSELEDHIELENDVLFPRAVAAEKRIFEQQ